MNNWEVLKETLIKYPTFFCKSDLTKEIFIWSFELLMTRMFGHGLPCSCLVPFGDLFNHHSDSATHMIINKKFETEELPMHQDYKLKKKKINLEIFKEEGLVSEGADFSYKNERKKFMKEKGFFLEDQEELRNVNIQVNVEKLEEEMVNIWDLEFFTTSNDEDNESDDYVNDKRQNEYIKLYEQEKKNI